MSIKNYNEQKQPRKVRPENYWRYKKNVAPIDENPELNGPVITRTLPSPFKCSKCEYIGTHSKDVQKHYFEDHA